MNPPNAVIDTGIDLKRKYPPLVPSRVIRWREAQIFADSVFNTRLMRMMGEVAEGFGMPIIKLKGEARTWPLVHYRQAFYCIMVRFSGYSISRIAKGLNRDHCTLVRGMRKMQPHMAAVAAELPADASPIEWAKALKRRIDQ
jgi:hypothetical protein